MKKLLAFLLAVVMVMSLAAVAGAEGYVGPDWEAIDAMDYDEACDALYEWNLGEFNAFYQNAKAEVTDLNLRMALMAQAEAKLMESGVFIPVYGDGGSYAMTRVVPRSGTTTSWGLDEYRWYTYIVANELITAEDRAALIALWGESEDAAAWNTAAKAFLADHGYTLNDTYNALTNYDQATWDIIATSYTSDSYFIACTYAPLMEYDAKNVQQFGVAESVDVSDDATVYTFHLRQGVKWVDQQGREIADVTADDWVASMMHLADNNDALGYLMSVSDGCGIKNYDAFINGEVDFSEVGVKAIDDYTLEYTLEAPFPAFLSMMGYGCFAPLNREYYKSQGGTFSAEGDEYTSGDFGTSPSNIAYCGPLLCTNYTEQNVWSYVANPTYWNPDALNIKALNFYYYDGTDVLRPYNEAKEGTVAGCTFNASAVVEAKADAIDGTTYFDKYSYTTVNSATTYCGWVNLFRNTWTNFNDDTKGVSAQTEEDIARTAEAVNNRNFRLAMAMAFDRGAYNAAYVGEDLKYASLKNAYITGTFQQLNGEATIDINGESVTFPAGTYFGEIEQAQLVADGCPIKVWDPEADGGVGSGDGFDGWFNAETAAQYMDAAVAELAEIGVEVSAENPIHMDVPYGAYNETRTNMYNVYKQCIEEYLGGRVIIDLIPFDTGLDWQYAYYRNSIGAEANYDVTPGTSGWGPDYGDAQTFLDTIQPYGYMTKSIGLY